MSALPNKCRNYLVWSSKEGNECQTAHGHFCRSFWTAHDKRACKEHKSWKRSNMVSKNKALECSCLLKCVKSQKRWWPLKKQQICTKMLYMLTYGDKLIVNSLDFLGVFCTEIFTSICVHSLRVVRKEMVQIRCCDSPEFTQS